jgi:hypothetical protein
MIYAGRHIRAGEEFQGTTLTVASTRIPTVNLPNSYAPLRYWLQVNEQFGMGGYKRLTDVRLQAGAESTVALAHGVTYHYVPWRDHNELVYTVCTLELVRTSLRRTRIDAVQLSDLSNGLYREWGQSLNLAGTRQAFLVIQPTEVVQGDGTGEFTLEHSSDQRSWEPLYHGGFSGNRLVLHQERFNGDIEVPLILTGCKQYVRWAYNPINPLAWGWRGKVGYRTVSLH